MLPDRIATPARALALILVTGVSIAGLAPLIGQPIEENAALWVATDHALVRVGMQSEGAHRTTDPLPGAAMAEVRVRGNRLITARGDALAAHTLTPTLELSDGARRALGSADVTGLAASPGADRIWLARPASDAGARKSRGKGPGRATGRDSTITAFSRALAPQWQRTLSGEVIALAAAPAGDDAVALWALQARRLVGLDHTGATAARVDLPIRSRVRDFTPLADGRFAVANARGVRIVDADGAVRHEHDRGSPRRLHALGADRSGATGLWSVGRHRITLFDTTLAVVRNWHLPSHGIGRKVAAARPDPRDDSLWFAAGGTLYHAHADGRLQPHRDLSDYLGREAVTELALYVDTFAPDLTLIDPEGTRITNNDQPELIVDHDDTGLGVDPDTLELEHGDAPVDSDCTTDAEAGRSACTLGPLADGRYGIRASVADHAGNESDAVEAVFEIDTIPPEITLDAPADGAHVNTDAVTLRGRLSEAAELAINGEPLGLDIDHGFERSLSLAADGAHSFELTAEDAAGNASARTIVVIRDTVAPAAIAAGDVTIEDGATENAVRIKAADGTAEPGANVVITNTRTGETAVITANGDGAFVAEMEGEVGDSFAITVRDRAGNESGTVEVDSGSEVPPDPEDVAPPLPETGNPPFEERISFLYEGSNPIQRDVAPGTIEAERVSILRGAVRDRAGDPIPGVTVSILNHPELGHTATQADGGFDMAVNGGGHLTVEYRKDGYLPVQRSVSTEWNGWYHADDVVLTRLDDRVTQIDLTDDSEAFQVARGSVVEDDSGARQATLLFPAGTTATITLPDGSEQQLSQLDVRATEYTVGDQGPDAMPGELPAASAYTYAVELSVDQARAQGVKVDGKDVTFNQEVPFYVDNFLDFPTGEPVPTGYYDNDAGRWIPYDNGRIVEILSVDSGRAVLDVTGDGAPATAGELDELGIADAERARLAQLYEPGQSLWRVALTHLSTWDCNWPYGPPPDAEGPDVPEAETPGDDEPEDSDEENPCDGCVISPQRQSLGESIPIAGTPFSLHYQSDRAAGAANNTVTIPLTDGDVPQSLKRVELAIQVNGRRFTEQFEPHANQSHTFTWDGRDAFGRTVVGGSAAATVRLSYVYECQYYGSSEQNGFGQFGDSVNAIGSRSRCQGFDISRTSTVTLSAPTPSRLSAVGNWSFSHEHDWDQWKGVLRRGDGRQRRLPYEFGSIELGNIEFGSIETVAGNGTTGSSGDGGPATEASLYKPNDVALGSDGTLYIADTDNRRIRRVSPDGTIDTFAGDTWPPAPADLHLIEPTGITVDQEGNLYIADRGGDGTVFRVEPDGQWERIAGGYGYYRWGYGGDGGPAAIPRTSPLARMAACTSPLRTAPIRGGSRTRIMPSEWYHRTALFTPWWVAATALHEAGRNCAGQPQSTLIPTGMFILPIGGAFSEYPRVDLWMLSPATARVNSAEMVDRRQTLASHPRTWFIQATAFSTSQVLMTESAA